MPFDSTMAAFHAPARKLLSLDGGAGFVVGVGMLALSRWLLPLYALSTALFYFVALANVAYGVYAGTLAIRAWRGVAPTRLATIALIGANAAWAVVCAVLVLRVAPTAHMLALGHIALEGMFCAGLAVAERRIVLPHAR